MFSKWKPFYIAPGGGSITRNSISLSSRKIAHLLERCALEANLFDGNKLREHQFTTKILPKYVNVKKLTQLHKDLAPNFIKTDGVSCEIMVCSTTKKKEPVVDVNGEVIKTVPRPNKSHEKKEESYPAECERPKEPSKWFVCDPGRKNLIQLVKRRRQQKNP